MKKYFRHFFIGLFILLLAGSLVYDISNQKVHKIIANRLIKTAKADTASESGTVTPTSAQPTPTLTPSPTASYSGYCIFVPVLMYHHVQPQSDAASRGQSSLSVDPGFFDQQMAYLSSKYVSISAQQLVDALRTHTPLPSNAIVVTLDDAYLDVYNYAYPILQKYHVTASLMVPTGLLGGVGNNSYFTWDQLKQMVNSGIIYAYDHTWSHYPVGSGSPDKDQFEIMTAKQQLESNLGKPVTIFTNPYGTGANNPRVVAELQQDGFTGAYSTIGGSYQCDSFIFSLHRTRIGNTLLSAYGL